MTAIETTCKPGDGQGTCLGLADFPATAGAARAARHMLASLLGGQDDVDHERADQCLFLLSEVVANVSEHADTQACPWIRVLWLRTGDILRADVYDPDPAIPIVGAARLEDEDGRGMWLLDAMAYRWGAEPVPAGGDLAWVGGKVVWFAMRGVWTDQLRAQRIPECPEQR